MMIIVIDYKVGNYFSLMNALNKCNVKFKVSNDIIDIEKSDALILPGVGSFKTGMENLNNLQLVDPIKNHFKKIKNYMFRYATLLDESEEFGFQRDWDLLRDLLKTSTNFKNNEHNLLPNITWSKIEKNQTIKNNFLKILS